MVKSLWSLIRAMHTMCAITPLLFLLLIFTYSMVMTWLPTQHSIVCPRLRTSAICVICTGWLDIPRGVFNAYRGCLPRCSRWGCTFSWLIELIAIRLWTPHAQFQLNASMYKASTAIEMEMVVKNVGLSKKFHSVSTSFFFFFFYQKTQDRYKIGSFCVC